MELQWRLESTPYSTLYSDIYFAEEDGFAESQYVFLEQNSLPTRFQENKNFVVAEIGFGTGLNFFSAWNLWQKTRSDSSWLHFISFEKFVLSPEQIERTLSRWPELSPLVQKFLQKYQNFPPGVFRLSFEDERISLTLIVGGAEENLGRMNFKADAWFLDGFAPRKNPELWSLELFQKITERSQRGTTFATFTAAGHVKRNLQAAGFFVEKFKGFGRKRDMLRGKILESATLLPKTKPQKVFVIGGGFAGAAISNRLAARNIEVSIFDRHSEMGSEASGNPLAVTFPSLSIQESPLSALTWQGLMTAKDSYQKTGLFVLEGETKTSLRWQKAFDQLSWLQEFAERVPASQTSEVCGIKLESSGIYLRNAGVLKPRSLLSSLTQSSLIQKYFQKNIQKIQKTQNGWSLWDEEKNIWLEADALIFANASDAKKFEVLNWLPLRASRGQIIQVNQNTDSQNLKTVLCGEHYMTPAIDYSHLVGATYSDSEDLQICAEETKFLQNSAQKMIHSSAEFSVMGARASLRASFPGQDPVAGALHDREGQNLNNCYGLLGLGSKGSLTAPPLAEILASEICGEPVPFFNDLYAQIQDSRFL